MLTKIKNTVMDNKEKVIIAGLTVAVGALGYYSVRTNGYLKNNTKFVDDILRGVEDGFIPTLTDDARMIKMVKPAECHCPVEKPKAEKTPKAA